MIIESCRVLNFVPHFSKALRHGTIGAQRLFSNLPAEKPEEKNTPEVIRSLIYKYPEFVPVPDVKYRNPVKEKLERKDMLRRRSVILLPEFYVGSILAVTSSDAHAQGKLSRFVGICIKKTIQGLRTTFLLRNVIEHQGVEVLYSLYSPLIQKIEVLRLEKRLDEDLLYLRDAPEEYSTFPFDMEAEVQTSKDEVPVNPIKVKLNPRPWLQRYERMDLKGAEVPMDQLSPIMIKKAKKAVTPWVKYDLMDQYRESIPKEEKESIMTEISGILRELEDKQKIEKKKKGVAKRVVKQKLF